MSVDFYDCNICGNTGVYEEEINWCETCDKAICTHCYNGELDENNYVPTENCPHCAENKKNEDKVKIDSEFETKYFGKEVKVKIIEVK